MVTSDNEFVTDNNLAYVKRAVIRDKPHYVCSDSQWSLLWTQFGLSFSFSFLSSLSSMSISDTSFQRSKVYWSRWNVVLLQEIAGNFVDETQDKWMCIGTFGYWKRTSEEGEVDKDELLRSRCEELEQEVIQVCTSGSRSRGRQRRRWTDDMSEWSGMTVNDAARVAEDRAEWREILRAANPSYGGRH